MHITESNIHIPDGNGSFEVTLIEAERPACVVFFAAGRGGSPLRHLGLLRSVARRGCTVVAPHFGLLPSTTPTPADLDTRIRRLELALQQYAQASKPIVGIGHSLGGVVLLVLAGAKARTLSGHEVAATTQWQFDGLALLAPAVDFFGHPEASLNVNTRIHLRAGNHDTIVPPNRVLAFKDKLPNPSTIEFYADERAGHFSYMDELPPHVKDEQPNRDVFLSVLAQDVGRFVIECTRSHPF